MCNLRNDPLVDTCVRCYEEFELATTTWARHSITGEYADGCSGRDESGRRMWYGGLGGVIWDHKDVIEFKEPLANQSMCPDCEEIRYEALRASDELRSPCVPEWFDPSYAGESWDEI